MGSRVVRQNSRKKLNKLQCNAQTLLLLNVLLRVCIVSADKGNNSICKTLDLFVGSMTLHRLQFYLFTG